MLIANDWQQRCSQPEQYRRNLKRRELFGCAFALTALGVLPAEASINMTFDVTQPPFNADQTGTVDATSAFQAVLNVIQSYGRGTMKIPGGNYTLGGGLKLAGASLTVIGDGQASSILVVTHKGTALSVQCTQSNQCITMRDVGFAPVPSGGGPAGVAVAITGLATTSGWQGCSIQDVDLGFAFPNYTSFTTGLSLKNVWRGRVDHVNMHSNIGPAPGSSFLILSGCVDLAVTACNVDQIDVPIYVDGYSEGVRVQQCVFVSNVGISTGTGPYIGNGSTSPLLNMLDLNVIDCEFNCLQQSLTLSYLNTGLITGCHFSGKTPYAAIHIYASEGVQINSCDITGNFNAKSPQQCIGIRIDGSPAWGSTGNCIDNCLFANLSCGVLFAPGAYISSATNIRMLAPGAGSLVGAPQKFGDVSVTPYTDASGNSTNYASAITAGSAISSSKVQLLTSRQ